MILTTHSGSKTDITKPNNYIIISYSLQQYREGYFPLINYPHVCPTENVQQFFGHDFNLVATKHPGVKLIL